jgi:hypothetical protein
MGFDLLYLSLDICQSLINGKNISQRCSVAQQGQQACLFAA